MQSSRNQLLRAQSYGKAVRILVVDRFSISSLYIFMTRLESHYILLSCRGCYRLGHHKGKWLVVVVSKFEAF